MRCVLLAQFCASQTMINPCFLFGKSMNSVLLGHCFVCEYRKEFEAMIRIEEIETR